MYSNAGLFFERFQHLLLPPFYRWFELEYEVKVEVDTKTNTNKTKVVIKATELRFNPSYVRDYTLIAR